MKSQTVGKHFIHTCTGKCLMVQVNKCCWNLHHQQGQCQYSVKLGKSTLLYQLQLLLRMGDRLSQEVVAAKKVEEDNRKIICLLTVASCDGYILSAQGGCSLAVNIQYCFCLFCPKVNLNQPSLMRGKLTLIHIFKLC